MRYGLHGAESHYIAIDFSWQGIPERLSEGLRATLLSLFERYIASSLTFLRRFLKETIVTIDCNLCQSLQRLLDTWFLKFDVPDGFEPPPQSDVDEVENNIESLFIFAPYGVWCDN